MQNGFTKDDWKLFRTKLPEWQNVYIDRLNKEYVELLNSDKDASYKFWELEKRIKKDKRRVGVSVQIIQSEFIFIVLELLRDTVITIADLYEFSDELKETINYIYNRYRFSLVKLTKDYLDTIMSIDVKTDKHK